MHDDGIPGRPLLGREDARHGVSTKRIGAQPVYRFSRQRNQPTRTKNLSSLRDGRLRLFIIQVRRVDFEPKSLHRSILAGLKRLALPRILAAYDVYRN